MVTFSKEELRNVAKLAALQLDEQELNLLAEQLQTIIQYTEQLQEVTSNLEAPSVRNRNIFRADEIKQSDTESLLSQAPQREGTYFVVPKILGE